MEHGTLYMRIAAMTHQGLIRPHNEDCMGAADWIRCAPMASPVVIECTLDEVRVAAIADGLGGHSGGEVASLLAVRDLLGAASAITGPETLHAQLHAINKRLYDIMQASPPLTGMGTTVVGLAAVDATVILFNVGDSRGYATVGDWLRLLSTDDSVDAAASDSSARTGVLTHGITQCLGGLATFTPIEPHVISRPAAAGDRYLLCSDGLTDMLDQDAMEACLTVDAGASVNHLMQAALAAGGLDNISVMIVDFYRNVVAPQ